MELHEIGSAITCLMVFGYIITCMAPTHWQTFAGYLLITFVGLPACLLLIAVIYRPGILIPATFILGVLVTQRRRA